MPSLHSRIKVLSRLGSQTFSRFECQSIPAILKLVRAEPKCSVFLANLKLLLSCDSLSICQVSLIRHHEMEKLHDNQIPLFVKCNGFVTILFQLANDKVTLSVDVPVLTQYVFVDSSIQDTRFSFTYSADVNVEVKMVDNSSDIIVSRLPTEKKVVAEINGTAGSMRFSYM